MLTIIAGKPGSGKSYHMSMLLVDMLTDWARYELKHREPYDSSVWINITLREDGLNETISKRVGQEVDVWKYINFCDSSFFNDTECIYWWTKFPAKAVIVIDEVHVYLGKKVEYGSLDLESELINWISQHRHTQQVIYFLSQHTDQFAKQILGIADTLLEIVNMKSLTLPFPISVPMLDIYELKSAWGIKTQYYQANVGNFRGKAIRWSGAIDRHMMTPDIYRVYKSHDTGMSESDRPSLNMSRWESVCWFVRKHGWHLFPKIGGIVAVPVVAAKVLLGLPVLLMEAAGGSSANAEVPAVTANASEVFLSSNAPVLRPIPLREEAVPVEKVESVPKKTKGAKVVMLFNGGVILDDSRKVTIGETIDFDGKTETLACACAVCGVIGFESGKRERF